MEEDSEKEEIPAILLDRIMESGRGSFFATHENRAYFQKLRSWNMGLPEEERIRYYGIDVEHPPARGFLSLQNMLADVVSGSTVVPVEVADSIGRLQAWNQQTSAEDTAALAEDLFESCPGRWLLWSFIKGRGKGIRTEMAVVKDCVMSIFWRYISCMKMQPFLDNGELFMFL